MKKTRIVFLAIAIVLSLTLIYWAFRYVADFPPRWHDPSFVIVVAALFVGALFLTVYLMRFKQIRGLATGLFVVICLGTCYDIMYISDMTKDLRKIYRESLYERETIYAEIDDAGNFKTQEQDEFFDNQSSNGSNSPTSKPNNSNRISESAGTYKNLSDDELVEAWLDGISAETDKDYEKAFKIYYNLAQQGHIQSIASLGRMYEEGLGVEKNYQEAIKFYKFLDGKDSGAMTRLGNLYYENTFLGVDKKEIARLWLGAAEMGDKNAQLNIGVCYLMGEGVEQNDEEAIKWLNKAAKKGVRRAREILDSLEKYGF